MIDYLPKDATSEQACNWLQAKTGQTWILPRLLECHLTPYFWLDYKPGYPTVYGEKIEGYQTSIAFQGDLCRLESDGTEALVTMFAAHDGSLVKIEPGLRVPLTELRFKRAEIEATAEIINSTAPAQAAKPAPMAGKKWTTDKLAELRAYRDKHTMPETADKFGITEQRIRALLPSNKPQKKPYSVFTHRIK